MQRFSRSIVTRLQVLFVVLAVAAVVLAGAVLWANYQDDRVIAELDRLRANSQRIEKLNGLVFAVVMESRGIYMADTPEKLERFAKPLLGYLEKMAEVVRVWEADVVDEDGGAFAAFKQQHQTFDSLRRDLVKAGRERGNAAAREIGDNDANRSTRSAEAVLAASNQLASEAGHLSAEVTRFLGALGEQDRTAA